MIDCSQPWYQMPEWWLCILALPSLAFVGWQSWETRKAAQAARISADGVLKQSELMEQQAEHMEAQTKELSRQNKNLLVAERAWVVEGVRFFDQIPRRNGKSGIMTAGVTLKNIGRQPATLRIVRLRFYAASELPEFPNFRSGDTFPDGFFLAPQQEIQLRVLLEQGSLDDEQVDRIEGQPGLVPLSLFIYGSVVYDSMNRRCTNQFCYVWRNLAGFTLSGDKQFFEKRGPKHYNHHT